MSLSLEAITFDCADPVSLAAFWSAALGGQVDDGASSYFASIGRSTPGTAPVMMFINVPEGKSAKNRVHLDLHAADRPAEVARLMALGASHVGDRNEHGHTWTTLQDPEGNEFCIAG
jgi:hypothetical protein